MIRVGEAVKRVLGPRRGQAMRPLGTCTNCHESVWPGEPYRRVGFRLYHKRCPRFRERMESK